MEGELCYKKAPGNYYNSVDNNVGLRNKMVQRHEMYDILLFQ